MSPQILLFITSIEKVSGVDAHLFRLLLGWLVPLLMGSRIEKIKEPAPGHLTIAFYGAGRKYNLCFRFGRQNPFCFVTHIRPQAMSKPGAMIMRLRKYLANQRVVAVVPRVWERRLWLMVSGRPDELGRNIWLCLDLVAGASLHFLQESDFPERDMTAWPDPADIGQAQENWKQWPCLTPALRKTLAGMDKREAAALLLDLESGSGDVYCYKGPDSKIARLAAWPLPDGQREGLQESASAEIGEVFEKAGQDLVLQAIFANRENVGYAATQRQAARLKKALARLDEDEQRLLGMTRLESAACLISANLWRLEANLKTESLELENGEGAQHISLDKRYTIFENMERMFHAVKRGKRGLKILADRRATLQAQLAAGASDGNLAKAADAGARRPVAVFRHFQSFTSSDGYRMLRGRDARGNDAIRKQASGHDLWVHVKDGPGAHVIIRRPHAGVEPPETTLREAGMLAVNKSWLREASEGEVMYAEVRYVRPDRSGGPGKVLIDKIWRTMLVPVSQAAEKELAGDV